MKPIDENEFEICRAQVARKHFGFFGVLKSWSVAINSSIQTSNDPTRLTARLRRDAGIDELEIEKNQLVKTPLIR